MSNPFFRVVICGSRTWYEEEPIRAYLERITDGHTAVCHGDAGGADRIAGRIATELGIPVFICPANWNSYRRAAGPLRNGWMLNFFQPHRLIAFRSPGESKGTDDMLAQARARQVPISLYRDGAWQ